jgi:uncharacterized protein YlaI
MYQKKRPIFWSPSKTRIPVGVRPRLYWLPSRPCHKFTQHMVKNVTLHKSKQIANKPSKMYKCNGTRTRSDASSIKRQTKHSERDGSYFSITNLSVCFYWIYLLQSVEKFSRTTWCFFQSGETFANGTDDHVMRLINHADSVLGEVVQYKVKMFDGFSS